MIWRESGLWVHIEGHTVKPEGSEDREKKGLRTNTQHSAEKRSQLRRRRRSH